MASPDLRVDRGSGRRASQAPRPRLMTGPSGTAPPSAVSVVGLGKLGLPLAACLSAAGFRTIGVDVIARNVAEINAGRSPIRRAGARRARARARRLGAPGHDEHPRSDRRDRRHLHHRPDAQRRDRQLFERAAARGDRPDRRRVSDGRRGAHLVVVSSTVMPGRSIASSGPCSRRAAGGRSADVSTSATTRISFPSAKWCAACASPSSS